MPSLLDKPLFNWTDLDPFTARQAFEGVGIFGSIGSGKTSGSGQTIALKYLQSGFGGIVLCAKEEELELWQHYTELTGRSDDLVVLGHGSKESFNFLDYESKRSDVGGGITHNIATVLMTVIRAGELEGDEKDKVFWDGTLRLLLVNAINLAMMVRQDLNFRDISKIISTAPTSNDDLENPVWRSNSFCFRCLKRGAQIVNLLTSSQAYADEQYETMKKIEDFFLTTWLNLSFRTRSIVEQMFQNFSARFLSEPLYSIFSNKTTISPDDTIEGKIIVLNLPYLIFGQAGRDGQILFKYIWQRAMQRRKIVANSRPVFLWADEAHLFLHNHDVDHQSTARSYRACTVYISQNLPNYYIHAGAGQQGRNRIEALLGNLGTKIFHANSCIQTNHYAADTLGKMRGWKSSQGANYGENFSFNEGASEDVEYVMQPAEFATLKTGGEYNQYQTEAVVHKQGAPFRFSQANYIRKLFNQNV